MKKTLILSISSALLALSSCKIDHKTEENIIEKQEIKIENGKFTPEVMWAMGKLNEYVVSPDKKQVAYAVSYYDLSANKGNSEIYLMNIDGSNVQRVTHTAKSEFNLSWTPDGKRLAFLRNTDSGPQIFEISIDGSNEKQISSIDGGLEGFVFSPTGKKLFYIHTIGKKNKFSKLYEGLPLATGRINDDLSYRHWDCWVDEIPHVFITDYNGSMIDTTSNIVDILNGEPYESPMRPWGGTEQIAWSPDGKSIAYTCRKKTGKEYATSTNSDIFLYHLESKTTTNISEGMMGYDQNPVFSTSGQYIAFESMERDGYEADKIRLMVYNTKTKERKYITNNFDNNASQLRWTQDESKLFFICPTQGTEEVWSYTFADSSFKRITKGTHDINSFSIVDNSLIAKRTSMSNPAELYRFDINTGKGTQLTNINTDIMKQLTMGKVEERWIKTTDNKEMLVWIIYPPQFDSTKSYPAILYCQGGPQSMVSQFWSTRWNFQIMANAGYIVVAPNRRGLPGFGQEWNEQISKDYGGQNMKDYLTAIDELAKEPYVDENRLAAAGASYGAFSVYWLAGNHNKRFKAFIAHNGMFNLEQQYLETEEMWFVNWDLGGPFWDKSNKTAQRSFANSPHKFVDKWDTPILVIHGELDYRIVASQGMAAYNAAVLKGIPARYLYFPDENHWVLQPQNSVLWHRNFIDWLDTWLKPSPKI